MIKYSTSAILCQGASANASNGSHELYRAWTSRGWRTRADPWTSVSGVHVVEMWVITSKKGMPVFTISK